MALVTPKEHMEPENMLCLEPMSSSYSLDSSFLSLVPVTYQATGGQKATSNTCRWQEALQLLKSGTSLKSGQGLWFSLILNLGKSLHLLNNLGHQGVAFSRNGHSITYSVKSSEEFCTVLS